MSELKTLIKELKETTQIANLDLEGSDPRTRPGREMLRNAAKVKVETLKSNYKSSLLQSIFTLFPTGKNSNTFAELAKEEGALVVDGGEFYNTLARRCQQTMGARQTFSISQFMVLNTELRGWAKEHNVDYTNLTFSLDTSAPTFSDVLNIVRELVEKENGQRLIKTYIEGQVIQKALEQEVDGKVVPVVVLNTTENQQSSLIGTLFRGRGLTVETDQEVTPEFINKTFQQVKKLLKGN